MKQFSAIIFAIFAVLYGTTAFAAEIDTREHIEVVGSAELKVVPNEFVIRTNLTHFDKSLQKASKQNASAVSELFREVRKLGIERKYVVTDDVAVHAITEGYRERGNFRRLGYNVSRDVMVIVHEATRVEPVMRTLFEAGVDRLSMSKGHTEMDDLLVRAQAEAGRAATRKAKVFSSTMGRLLGKAVAISEENSGRHEAQNFVYSAATPDLGDSLSLGKIRVQAAVRVKYLLK